MKVTEQDIVGTLNQETSYNYNLLDKLTFVNQGNQTRSFKYDALGRLLFERVPEQSATINTYWSAKYTYTEYNAVSTKQDARGVVTSFTYNALHRVTATSYDTSNAAGVATTPDVSFGYDTAGALSSVNISGQYNETIAFDVYHRVEAVTRWMLGQTYNTNKTYTTGYEYNQASQTATKSGTTLMSLTHSYQAIARRMGWEGFRDPFFLGSSVIVYRGFCIVNSKVWF